MLLHIRSPGGYNFMRNNNLLPLPCIRTIRHYLELLDVKCGFDKHFFELFKKYIEKKSAMQKHGIILFDEMSVRQAISVCSKTLTYKGLVDFGDDKKAKTIQEQATHALVFMFQPLADNYTQPLAVFASKGPVVGIELTKLLLKCIVHLEKSGAIIHGFVSDGAQTNRKLWSELGINGQKDSLKNWFTHPLEDNRKIFAFSDTPHLIKNVRNRLYNQKVLKVMSLIIDII